MLVLNLHLSNLELIDYGKKKESKTFMKLVAIHFVKPIASAHKVFGCKNATLKETG